MMESLVKNSLFSLLLGFIVSVIFSQHALSQEKLIVKHYQKQLRYEFGVQLLDLALSKLDIPYEIIVPKNQFKNQSKNEARGEIEVIRGLLDLEFMSTTAEREAKMIPIKIPIYRGILGLRLILVTKANRDILKDVLTLSDLRNYTAGHGAHWGDLPVYAENELPVQTNAIYELLFKMLIGGRFDYFHRGLNEIWDEQTRYPNQLVVSEGLMLFYPHPVYFFVTKKRPELAEQIRKGLNISLLDGSFKTLFLEHHGPIIKKANLTSRNLIILKNPVIPDNTSELDTQWWLPDKHQSQIKLKHPLPTTIK